MPIKGLLDTPRLPRIGKIHLGVMVDKGDKTSPKALDYFVVPVEVQQALKEEKPQKLRIAFPCEDPEVFAPHFYKRYSSYRGLVCKGDGEKARRLCEVAKVVDKDGVFPDDKHPRFWPLPGGKEAGKTAFFDINCPPESCDEYIKKQCRPSMNLQVLLLDVPGLGVWQIDTRSWESMRNILNTVAHIKQYGKISLIPLILSLEPEDVAPEGVKKKVYILHLTAPYSLSQLYDYLKLPPGRALLPEPDTEPPDDLITSEAQESTAPPGEESRPANIDVKAKPGNLEQDIFGEKAAEERDKNILWKEIGELLTAIGQSRDTLIAWFRQRHNQIVSLEEAMKTTPPRLVTVAVLTQLRDSLRVYRDQQKSPGNKTNQGKLLG